VKSILFEPVSIRNLKLQNRFVRSATGDGCGDREGHITDKHIKLFADLAYGGIGLIITGIAYVHASGQLNGNQTSIADDNCIPGLRRLTRTVHEKGAKIAVQLFHSGCESARFFGSLGKVAKGPYFVKDDPYSSVLARHATKNPSGWEYDSLTEEDIWELIRAFGDAAVRAREAGFDAVQLHGAHAYLLSQFLSPHSNRRTDEWGGSLEKRLRFHREIYNDIRKKVGADYPVLMKIGVQDGFPGGLELEEGKKAAVMLSQWGYDALEISQGLRGKIYEGMEYKTKINSLDREGYFADWCREIKKQVTAPVMAVGGFRTFALMEKIVQDGEADFIALCRPFIRQPDLVNRWKKGSRERAACISCNGCLEALMRQEILHCVCEERAMN
jgi:2,4-dienoyl-CoA reductase-like NADH-dependent reductase (Old Yellow Enzyme family)